MKKYFLLNIFGWPIEDHWRKEQVRSRFQIRKSGEVQIRDLMSQIWNSAFQYMFPMEVQYTLLFGKKRKFCVYNSFAKLPLFFDLITIIIPRVPQCLSPRPNWVRPSPISRKQVARPPKPKGGGQHLPAGEGVDGPNSDDWREIRLKILYKTFWLTRDHIIFISVYTTVFSIYIIYTHTVRAPGCTNCTQLRVHWS